MAGLCRSIIENVFTKVIRIENVKSLGEKIVVQGGTFLNDAVLRAMEQYIGREVVRAPYPGIMGAIGTALLTKERFWAGDGHRTFMGWDFSMILHIHRRRTRLVRSVGTTVAGRSSVFPMETPGITNNRCERGEILGDPRDGQVRRQLLRRQKRRKKSRIFSHCGNSC